MVIKQQGFKMWHQGIHPAPVPLRWCCTYHY